METFIQDLGSFLPGALAALGVLIGGWIVALIVRRVVRSLLERSGADRRLGPILGEDEDRINLAHWVSRIVYYVIMLFVVVAVLNVLNLGTVAAPFTQLLETLTGYLSQLLGAGALLVVAWILASLVRFVITRVFTTLKLDERLSSQADIEAGDQAAMSNTIANVAYWLIFLLFLPAIVGALGLEGLLEPMRNMVDEILGVLPDIIGAGVILFIGWLVARIVRQITTNLLSGVGVDRWAESAGVSTALGGQTISQIIGTVVYVLVLIPVLIAAVNALGIEAIANPASAMLTSLLTALPAIFGALLLVGVAYFVARVVGGFVANVLAGIGFNSVLSWIGLGGSMAEGRQTPSQIVGYLTTLAIMLFAVIEAANLLGFTILSELVSQFLVASSGVLLALVVFGLGLYLAGLADRVVRSAAGAQANLLAPAARIAVIIFAGALALRQTGIAEDIVNLAFGLIVGSIAVAAALAFGLGGRDIAGEQLSRWLSRRGGSGS